MKKTLLFLALMSMLNIAFAQRYSISGYVKEANSQELLLGTTIYVPDLELGTTANAYGFYSLTLPKGKYKIQFSFVGYKTQFIEVDLSENIQKDITLEVEGEELEEVVVTADKSINESDNVRSGVINMPIKQMKAIPSLFGEKDLLKVIQLMPGIQKGTEGQSGIYVRGGGPDQNLLILDDAPVYNAQHLFGFFSVFNGDALRSAEVIKGGFPAKYGGRLSSVINMNMKDGNKERYTGEVGVGLISSRLVVEGPIVKDKSSFLISGRRTYVDLITAPIMKAIEDIFFGYYFYDFNAKVNYTINNKNKLYLSGYFGRDYFYVKENGETSKLGWGNQTATFRWNHQFNTKLFANTSVIYSHYRFKTMFKDELSSFEYKSGIDDYGAKIDFNFYPMPKHTLQFGLASTFHIFMPKAVSENHSMEGVSSIDKKQTIEAIENGIYIEDLYKPINNLQILAGLRYSSYVHKQKYYDMFEPRLSVAYKTSSTSAIKASYAITSQYIHMLSNTGIGLPSDLWVSSTDRVKPQKAWQVAGGFTKDFPSKNISVSIEGYYKEMNDIIGFKESANLMEMGDDELLDNTDKMNDLEWENMVTRGNGKSYGVELLIQRKIGKLTGWIGYTLSWTKHKFPELNFGKEFWAKYDRRHDLSIVASYSLSEKIKFAGTWVFATGNAFTLPTSTYAGISHNPFDDNGINDNELPNYLGKNTFRVGSYNRLDFGVQFIKKKKRGVRTWDLSIYNVYCRRNPMFYYLSTDYDCDESDSSCNSDKRVVRQAGGFPILPSITYSFKFK